MKIKIYLDQNVLGYLADESISFNSDNFQFVYSETHFKEFTKDNYSLFCKTLDNIQARCIKINIDGFSKIRNDCTLLSFIPSEQLYLDFSSRYNPNVESYNDGLLAYLYGSMDRDSINSFTATVNDIFNDMPSDIPLLEPYKNIVKLRLSELDQALRKNLPEISYIENTRKEMGTDKGKLNVLDSNAINKINKFIKDKFSIDILGTIKSQLEGKSIFEKVVGLHSFLNILGYQPDKNLKQIQNITNSRHDGEHIGYSSFCDCLISEDRRLINKAKAIFEYLNIPTNILHLKISKK